MIHDIFQGIFVDIEEIRPVVNDITEKFLTQNLQFSLLGSHALSAGLMTSDIDGVLKATSTEHVYNKSCILAFIRDTFQSEVKNILPNKFSFHYTHGEKKVKVDVFLVEMDYVTVFGAHHHKADRNAVCALKEKSNIFEMCSGAIDVYEIVHKGLRLDGVERHHLNLDFNVSNWNWLLSIYANMLPVDKIAIAVFRSIFCEKQRLNRRVNYTDHVTLMVLFHAAALRVGSFHEQNLFTRVENLLKEMLTFAEAISQDDANVVASYVFVRGCYSVPIHILTSLQLNQFVDSFLYTSEHLSGRGWLKVVEIVGTETWVYRGEEFVTTRYAIASKGHTCALVLMSLLRYMYRIDCRITLEKETFFDVIKFNEKNPPYFKTIAKHMMYLWYGCAKARLTSCKIIQRLVDTEVNGAVYQKQLFVCPHVVEHLDELLKDDEVMATYPAD